MAEEMQVNLTKKEITVRLEFTLAGVPAVRAAGYGAEHRFVPTGGVLTFRDGRLWYLKIKGPKVNVDGRLSTSRGYDNSYSHRDITYRAHVDSEDYPGWLADIVRALVAQDQPKQEEPA